MLRIIENPLPNPPRKGEGIRTASARGKLKALWREDDDDSPAVHCRGLLQLGVLFQLLAEPVDELVAFVDVGVFAAAEDHRENHFVFGL
jgi:hypothetical protein